MQYCHVPHHAPAVFHRFCISDYHTYPISQLNTKYTCENKKCSKELFHNFQCIKHFEISNI